MKFCVNRYCFRLSSIKSSKICIVVMRIPRTIENSSKLTKYGLENNYSLKLKVA